MQTETTEQARRGRIGMLEERIGEVRTAIFETREKLKNVNPSHGDYIRLLELERKLEEMQKEEEPPLEIKVTWVDQPVESEK